jgi:hypothetical protein
MYLFDEIDAIDAIGQKKASKNVFSRFFHQRKVGFLAGRLKIGVV